MSERGGDKLNDNTVNCRVCQRPIQAKDSVDRGVGLTCVEHAPCKDIATIERRDIKYWITESYEDISRHAESVRNRRTLSRGAPKNSFQNT